MPEISAPSTTVTDLLRRWETSGAAERANYQLFLSELCDLLTVPRPEPTSPDDRDNVYEFERSVTFRHGDGSSNTGSVSSGRPVTELAAENSRLHKELAEIHLECEIIKKAMAYFPSDCPVAERYDADIRK